MSSSEVGTGSEAAATTVWLANTLDGPGCRVCWCDAWVATDSDGDNVFPLTRVYLRQESDAAAQWITADARFASSVSRSLLGAARNWYRRRGAYDLTVQYSLGKLSGH